jgi:NAD(P)-dependent dehydrogenase (short-subunit alcohol dehydrogenase family)
VADRALVCGAAGVLGAAVVAAFEERGDDVIALDRSRLDMADPDAVDRFWDDLAGNGELPRWVVNAVGGFRAGTVAGTEPWEVRAAFSLNLETAWWTARAAAGRLEHGAALVNVSSRAAVSGGAGSAAYAVAKSGVVRLTEVLADELAPRGVRVNAVLPSIIDTPQNRAALSEESLQRAVAPERIASVIVFLCSDAAAAVTGAAIPVGAWA